MTNGQFLCADGRLTETDLWRASFATDLCMPAVHQPEPLKSLDLGSHKAPLTARGMDMNSDNGHGLRQLLSQANAVCSACLDDCLFLDDRR